MPRKLSYKDLETEHQRLQIQCSLNQFVVNLLVDKVTPDSTETAIYHSKGYNDTYVFSLYNSLGPHGGIVTMTHQHPGQKNHTDVHYLDGLLSDYRNTPTEEMLQIRIALDRLANVRSMLLDNMRLSCAHHSTAPG